jgi:simple sugar transport system ATP-binding protein
VVLGRELSGEPKFVLANQPTRGLDVGSIEFVHQTLIAARDRGAAILLISVELEEIRALSDRIAVLYRGRIVGEMPAAAATESELGVLMAGGQLQPEGQP